MAFPTLEVLDLTQNPPFFAVPTKKINDGPDVTHFLASKAYRDINIFVMQLNRSVVPRKSSTSPSGAQTFPLRQTLNPLAPPTPVPEEATLETASDEAGTQNSTRGPEGNGLPEPITALRGILDRVRSYIDEAPPDPGPRRFGNVSFRTWHALLAQRTPALLEEFVPSTILNLKQPGGASAKDEIEAYFLGAFGSAQRLDYGTGHELSFLAFLGCLWKLNFFSTSASSAVPEDTTTMSRHIVLSVIEPYLATIRALITTYTLEPAGSHGVWGLDDHAFIPYIFGSAQLTRPITEEEPTPLEGSVRGAPRTGDIVKADAVERWRASNMYFSGVGFINDVKKGPFWEHSPMLFDISGVKDGWGKINKGMIKMFNAEVLSKFPVVQHFPFGCLFSWDQDPDAPPPSAQSVHVTNQPTAPTSRTGSTALPTATGTAAPWAQAPTGMPTTRAPWVAAGPGPGREMRTTGRPVPPSTMAGGEPGTTAAQMTVTKAPWARNG